MFFDEFLKFLKKNGMLLTQIFVLLLPFVIFILYSAKESDEIEIPELEKVESVVAVEKVKTENKSEDKKLPPQEQQKSPSTFEVDEVSREMLNKNINNPKEMLSSNASCVRSENVKTISKHTGTISKAKNVEKFKRPLPAMITEVEYTCIDAKGGTKTKFTTMGIGVDSETNTLRCIQSNSDEAMNSEERFKHVVKTMTHHCGFKLSEHTDAKK